MTLFDVVLPTRGRAHTIGFAIESVLRQTEPDFLLHVVGDGCGEETERVVAGFDDPRVAYTRFPKGEGFGYGNRNAVLRVSTSPFVAYMTDDDLMLPEHLALARKALEESRRGLVAFRCAQVRFPDDLDPFFFPFDWRIPVLGDFLRNWFIGSANLAHRRGLFGRIGYWDASLERFGDREFYRRARLAGEATYREDVTLLRFFAAEWDARYAALSEPPQKRWLGRVGSRGFAEGLRSRIAGRRGPRVRMAQARDFLRFAARSGPRFARFVARRRRSMDSLTGGI
ncbi:MAG TPA: glycosyltransferase family A protein [Thermoanaerobaculia bacterium]|nr:glycosyltransferase family A protein [Thermoanaerobaculia bacterium]